MSHASALVIRVFDFGHSQGSKDRRLAQEAQALMVFATEEDGQQEWLVTGRGLTRVLLRFAGSGATASFLNQPIEVPELRGELAVAVGISEVPQLLLRCGYGPEVRAEPRRSVDSVVMASERGVR
jgi:hypothetical protein